MRTKLSDELLVNFLWQKRLLLERAKVKRIPETNFGTALAAHGRHMEKLADIVKDWAVDPGILMEAVFAWARRNKHSNGPMPGMLTSVKYLCNALAFHLELPFEAIAEKRSMSLVMEKLDEAYAVTSKTLEGVKGDLSVLTSYPVEFRYVMARRRMAFAADGDLTTKNAALWMSSNLLERMRDDRRLTMWMEHRGYTYGQVAEFFNANIPS